MQVWQHCVVVVVIRWLSKHTEFISNPFYVGGDSYSGKVIPATVQEISKGMCVFLHTSLFFLGVLFIIIMYFPHYNSFHMMMPTV